MRNCKEKRHGVRCLLFRPRRLEGKGGQGRAREGKGGYAETHGKAGDGRVRADNRGYGWVTEGTVDKL